MGGFGGGYGGALRGSWWGGQEEFIQAIIKPKKKAKFLKKSNIRLVEGKRGEETGTEINARRRGGGAKVAKKL